MILTIPNNTKALLLDLGGVILQLKLQATFTAFEALGCHHFNTYFDSYSGAPFIESYEEGKITNEAFVQEVLTTCYPGTTIEQVHIAWNAMLGTIPQATITYLAQLSTQYKLILYSNTNALHVAYLTQYYNQAFGMCTFQNLFTHIYYSHILGIRKPHASGFVTILEQQQLMPNQVYYIDDGVQHIATATTLGIPNRLWLQNDILG